MDVVKAITTDIHRAVDLAFSMQGSIKTRCRPLLINATREQIYEWFLRFIKRKDHDLLLVENDGELVGLTPIYWIEEDLYVSYDQGPYGYDYEAVSNSLYNYVTKKFRGYKFYVNTASEHTLSIEFYESKNFQQIEKAVMLKLESFRSNYSNMFVQELNEHNKKDIYEWIEKDVNDDTYWNSKRIDDNLSHFIILGYFDKKLKGHIIGRGSITYTEIIAFTGDEEIKEELLKSFISIAHKRNIKKIDLYTEKTFEEVLGIKCGFKLYDNNNCYLKYL